jgi:hypothetical protein
MQSNTTFTKKQIHQFRSYEMVRKSGVYNMFSSQARLATCLDKDEYIFIMENYSALKDASESVAADEMLLKATDKS